MKNTQTLITRYLDEHHIVPKQKGYQILADAITIAIEHPELNASEIFTLISESRSRPSWKYTYRLAEYSLSSCFAEECEKQPSVLLFVRSAAIAIKSKQMDEKIVREVLR